MNRLSEVFKNIAITQKNKTAFNFLLTIVELFLHTFYTKCGARNSIFGIATGYGLADRGVRVRVLVGSRIFSSLRHLDRL
jgi:hypothetical protein